MDTSKNDDNFKELSNTEERNLPDFALDNEKAEFKNQLTEAKFDGKNKSTIEDANKSKVNSSPFVGLKKTELSRYFKEPKNVRIICIVTTALFFISLLLVGYLSYKTAKLQVENDEKYAQLEMQTALIKRLEIEQERMNSSTSIKFWHLKQLVENNTSTKDLIESLENIERDYRWEQIHAKELLHWEKLIDLEKSTLNRPTELAHFFIQKAYCHSDLKQYQEAINALTLAMHYNPNDYLPWFSRGATHHQLGNLLKARDDYMKALELYPGHDYSRDNLAQLQKVIDESN